MEDPSTQEFHHLRSFRWPSCFTERREFNKAGENQPYVEFIGGIEGFDTDSGEEDEDEDNVNSLAGEDRSDTAVVEYETQANQGQHHDDNGPLETDLVRRFMRHAEEKLRYYDQAEKVEDFCQGASLSRLRDGKFEGSEKPVAFLDDRSTSTLWSRPYRGPLTAPDLYQALMREVW
jgi:hypothetical protein